MTWIIDPYDETVTVHRLKAKIRSHHTDEELPGEPELPGFSVPAARLFE
jgi:Uma2 family endonuclease